ncbi:hypothetical protein [Paenibacillus sp. RC67]|uniref:hypothetical protein n=1 Tax=Paenibacillus sp. RC67 TaxID=3039392 RepID=UPI0024AE386D|nr:hypothetical protein [Paenibacillus sp. RC67]
MLNNPQSFDTIHPKALFNITAMLLLEGCLILNLLNSRNIFIKYFYVLVMLIVVTIIGVLVKRRFFTKLNITLGIDYVISTNGKLYTASQIECIFMNYNRIGFKLYGKRIVPIDLCFYFNKQQEAIGLEKVKEWADQNNKEVKNRFFQTLI